MQVSFDNFPSELLGTQYQFKRFLGKDWRDDLKIIEIELNESDFDHLINRLKEIDFDYAFIVEAPQKCREIKNIIKNSIFEAEINFTYPWKTKDNSHKFPMYIKRI